MRFLIRALAAACLLWAPIAANAYTIQFGSPVYLGSCSQAGNSADRSCSQTASINNGALDNVASANIRGQASADQGLSTNPTAIADITITYDIPYTITRTVTFASQVAYVPELSLLFNATYQGSTGHDNSQVGGGLANAVAYTASLSDSGGNNLVFGTTNYAGTSNGGGGGPSFSPFTVTGPDPSATLTAAYQGSAGELTVPVSLPTNFRVWTDASAPFGGPSLPNGYYPDSTWTQTYTDVLRVSFRLRAESRASGSVSTTGGEALACAGLTSPLGGFDLDDGGGNCGSGFSLTASLSQIGTFSFPVPEPTTLVLFGAGLLGLGWVGRRSRQA